MAVSVQQDVFMDDSDDQCPLCVEEFDLSDKNFRPCPCGYQVCQFCYNNIKNTLNGLCPACRRPYDDRSIEWKIVSPEEQKADIALQARKKAAARKKESEQKQVESLNRKHLQGLRVVQKNLVYVVGLSRQNSGEEEFLQTLRGDQYFGQYGKIIKIVVSKPKEGSNSKDSIGVYVTFEKREDAAKCVAAVDGSRNLDRPLRAQYGTTKYCSAYIRNEICGNRNCTFLHETGEDYDSFSRQDLSSMNAMSTQRPPQQSSSSKPTQSPQPQPPPQQAPQSISAASRSGPSQSARDEAMSRSDSGDGSALPSSASWATKNAQNESRRSSKPASVAASSPNTTNAAVSAQVAEPQQNPIEAESEAPAPSARSLPETIIRRRLSPHPLERALKIVSDATFKFTFDRSLYDEEELKHIDVTPMLFGNNSGITYSQREKEQEQEQKSLKDEQDRNVLGAISAAEEDENPGSGSLQLGGEPESQEELSETTGHVNPQQRSMIQPPYSSAAASVFPFGGPVFQANNPTNLPRNLTPQQQQQQQLSLLRSTSNLQSPISNSQLPQNYSQNQSLHQQQSSNPFQQIQNPGFSSIAGHARHASRFSFANDSASASAAVKPAANPQLMAQQSAMMPTSQSKQYQNQHFQQPNVNNNHFYSGVQGPPPGLKSSGTPPISGGGMFGQGHGFASAMGGSAGFGGNFRSKNSNEELVRELLQTRNGYVNGLGPDSGKRIANVPRFAGAAPKVDNLVRDAANITPAGPSSSHALPMPVPAPATANPGLTSSQDFPPLVAPKSQPPIPPRTQRKPTKTNVRPLVPAIPTPPVAKAGPPQDLNPNDRGSNPLQISKPSTPAVPEPNDKAERQDEALNDRATAAKSEPQVTPADESSASQRATAFEIIDKKQRPDNINIEAARDASRKDFESVDTLSEVAKGKQKANAGATPSGPALSQPTTPATIVSQTFTAPALRPNQPRTTRVVPTPKHETPPHPVFPSPGFVPSSSASKQTSRRPSITSTNQPGTPTSVGVSDHASLISGSASRANSPPPASRVGIAPVRQTTKSQQKKERQARAKAAEESAKTEEPAAKVEEPVQAPVIGRKKKARKTGRSTAESTPTVTRPTSPEPVPKEEDDRIPPALKLSFKEREKIEPSLRGGEVKMGPTKVVTEIKEPDPTSNPETATTGEPQKAPFTAVSILASLQKTDLPLTDLFKNVPGVNARFDHPDFDLVTRKLPVLSDGQTCQLDAGEAISIDIGKGRAIVVLPDRHALRGLSTAQASRYLQLRKQVSHTREAERYERDFSYLTPVLHTATTPLAPARGEPKELVNRFATMVVAPAVQPAVTRAEQEGLFPRAMSVDEAEQEVLINRKKTEGIEKKLNALLKKNKRMIFGGAH